MSAWHLVAASNPHAAEALAAEPGELARKSIQKAIDCANALHQLDAENEALRGELRAAKSEIEALKRHIEQMAVLA